MLDKNVRENIDIIEKIENYQINYLDLYESIKSNNKNTKMTRSRKSSLSIFGMFVPDTMINFCTGGDYVGKLTHTEKGIDYKYYFDDNGKVVLTERYANRDGVVSELIFYFYNQPDVEFVLYRVERNEIGMVGIYQYNEDNRLAKYLEGRIPYKSSNFKSYYEILFSYNTDSCEMTVSSCGFALPDKISLSSHIESIPMNVIEAHPQVQ